MLSIVVIIEYQLEHIGFRRHRYIWEPLHCKYKNIITSYSTLVSHTAHALHASALLSSNNLSSIIILEHGRPDKI